MQSIGSSSLRDYERVYNRMWREAAHEAQSTRGEWSEVTAHDLVKTWRTKVEQAYGLSTLRKYRAALIHILAERRPTGWEDAIRALADSDMKPSGAGEASTNQEGVELMRSGRKRQSQRMIPEADFAPLLDWLESVPEDREASVWRQRAAWAMRAGVATGCRPLEWLGATWLDRESGILRIHSIKQKARDAWDQIPALTFLDSADELAKLEDMERWREIDAAVRHNEFARKVLFLRALGIEEALIDELIGFHAGNANISAFRDIVVEPEFVADVDRHIGAVQAFMQQRIELHARKSPDDALLLDEIFSSKYLSNVRNAIWRGCERIFLDGRLYSLADTRSTFAANRKALAGLKAASLELGHAWPQTTRDFYAPARRAWARYAHVTPRVQEMARDHARLLRMSPLTPVPQAIAAATA